MKRILRRIGAWAVALLVVGAGVWFAVPYVLGMAIDVTCGTPADAGCQARMRSLGHIWSARGNLDKARGWYSLAAGGGDAAAMFHLAWAYGEEYRSEMAAAYQHPADEAAARAIQWYEGAASHGFAPAANNLGEIYAFGLGVPADPAKAHQFHLQAAEAGNPAGAANTAIDFAMGRGVERDVAQAEHWSVIEPAKAAPADLAEPTFERTLVYGEPIPATSRREIRLSAERGLPFTFHQKPLAPEPGLPGFQSPANLTD